MPLEPVAPNARSTPSPSRGSGGPRRGWLLGAAAATAVAGVVAQNTRSTVRTRNGARGMRVDLDHGAAVGSGLGEPLTLWVLGDSAAAGYGLDDPRHAFPFQLASQLAAAAGRRVEVESFATDGHTTADVRTQQLWKLRNRSPDVVAINVGVNDALKRHALSVVRAETAALLREALVMLPASRIVLVGCPDLRNAPGLPRPLNLIVGRLGRRVARVQSEVAAELGVAFAPISITPRAEHFGPDGFHPGAEGQRLMAELAVGAVLHGITSGSDHLT